MPRHTGELSDKQRRFVEEYCKDFNASRAALDAGYSAKTAGQQGFENLKKPEISSAIKEFMDSKTEEAGVTVESIVNIIQDTIARCSQAKPVYDNQGRQKMTEDGEGNLHPMYAFDATNVLKGAEMLGRWKKMFTDKTELSNPDGSMKPPPFPVYKVVKE